MEATPDVLEQVPAGGGMNKPESGTYGEQTELAALQQALPAQPASPQPQMQPVPSTTGGGVSAPPSGLPRGLTAPTTRPDVPASTPLGPPQPTDPYAGAVDARQRRLRLLDILSQSPDSSEEIREWASILKQKLIARG